MINFWDNWEKPWTQSQCERVYIESVDKFSMPKLAVISGVSKKTIEDWYYKNLWKEGRAQFQANVEAAARKRQEELKKQLKEERKQKEDVIPDRISAIQREHFEAYYKFRQLVMYKIDYLLNACSPNQPGEHRELQIVKLDGKQIESFCRVLQIATNGERMALGMEYEDLNKAIRVLTQAGFEVAVPADPSVLSAYLPRRDDDEDEDDGLLKVPNFEKGRSAQAEETEAVTVE